MGERRHRIDAYFPVLLGKCLESKYEPCWESRYWSKSSRYPGNPPSCIRFLKNFQVEMPSEGSSYQRIHQGLHEKDYWT